MCKDFKTTRGSDKDYSKNTKIEQPQEITALHRLTNDARAQRSHNSKGKGDQFSHDIIIKKTREICNYYSFVDKFYRLTNDLKLIIKGNYVHILIIRFGQQRALKTYENFNIEYAAKYKVLFRYGQLVYKKTIIFAKT